MGDNRENCEKNSQLSPSIFSPFSPFIIFPKNGDDAPKHNTSFGTQLGLQLLFAGLALV